MKTMAIGLLFFFTTSICLSNETPKEIVETIFSKAALPEVSKDIKIQDEINSLVDFNMMAKNSLGAEYQKQNEAEKKWYVTTLKEIVTKSVYPSAPDFLKQVKITYKNVTENSNEAFIKSSVRSKGEDTDVDYKLRKEEKGWKVYDIAIDGESWTNSIKIQVQKSLSKDGWKGLKEKLNKRLAKLKTQKT